jgi:hypothetical protein
MVILSLRLLGAGVVLLDSLEWRRTVLETSSFTASRLLVFCDGDLALSPGRNPSEAVDHRDLAGQETFAGQWLACGGISHEWHLVFVDAMADTASANPIEHLVVVQEKIEDHDLFLRRFLLAQMSLGALRAAPCDVAAFEITSSSAMIVVFVADRHSQHRLCAAHRHVKLSNGTMDFEDRRYSWAAGVAH